MKTWKKVTSIAFTAALAVGLAACSSSEKEAKVSRRNTASDYPKSNITIVAPSGAGGGWDLTARCDC